MALDSELITSIFSSIPKKISIESIETVLANVAFINAQVYSDKSIITPSIIGYQALVGGATIQQALSTANLLDIEEASEERSKQRRQQQQQQKQ